MSLTELIPLLALVVTNLLAVAGIVYYMASTLGKRDSLDKRMDDMNANINARFNDLNARFSDLSHQMDTRFNDMNTRIDDLRSQMNREHDALSQKVDAHINNQQIHQPRV